MANYDLSIVIPAYKEELRLPPTLEKLIPYLQSQQWSFEIILVIEPSPDGTLKEAKKWENQFEEVKLIENPHRLGKGGSVQAGVLKARGKIIAFMDADGSTDFSFLKEGFTTIQNKTSKVVIASRGLRTSIIDHPQSSFRKSLGLIYRWLTKKITSLPYEDTQCGCKMFSFDTIDPLFTSLIDTGFAFDLEILLKAKIKNITVLEMPCIWRDVEGTTVRPFHDGMKMLKAIFRLKYHYFKRHDKAKKHTPAYVKAPGSEQYPLAVPERH